MAICKHLPEQITLRDLGTLMESNAASNMSSQVIWQVGNKLFYQITCWEVKIHMNDEVTAWIIYQSKNIPSFTLILYNSLSDTGLLRV